MASPEFPPSHLALREPNGLLAIGGDLSAQRLLYAYSRGIFPWFSPGEPVLWWTPDPRAVLRPENFRVSRSLRKSLRSRNYRLSLNQRFGEVIRACAAPRDGEQGTWIVPEMITAYEELHREGFAHSLEVWLEDDLVGGLYGVAMGRAFFGESMFSRANDASKTALGALALLGRLGYFAIIDCQVESQHLASLGAELLDRPIFEKVLAKAVMGDRNEVLKNTARWGFVPPDQAAWQAALPGSAVEMLRMLQP